VSVATAGGAAIVARGQYAGDRYDVLRSGLHNHDVDAADLGSYGIGGDACPGARRDQHTDGEHKENLQESHGGSLHSRVPHYGAAGATVASGMNQPVVLLLTSR
jgi:hypothetical protein